MEDGVKRSEGGEKATVTAPPPPPEPNALKQDAPRTAVDEVYHVRSDEPLQLTSDEWDLNSISSLAALRMLMEALMTLADITGDVPPTPPASRPTTPRGSMSTSSGEGAFTIGSPEVRPREYVRVIGADAEEHFIQHNTISKRFFSKVAPPFSLADYLTRFHHWCPHSPGVYLTAAAYCYRLCVVDFLVPATSRTIHRLALASIRIATKAVEDHKWPQERIAKVGGISKNQLMNLEVALCFLLDFEVGVDENMLKKTMFGLQQAARHGRTARGSLDGGFKLSLSGREKAVEVPAEA